MQDSPVLLFGSRSSIARKYLREIFYSVNFEPNENWRKRFHDCNGVDPFSLGELSWKLGRPYSIEPKDGPEGGKLLYSIQVYYANLIRSVLKKELGLNLDCGFPECEIDIPGTAFFEPGVSCKDRFAGIYQDLFSAAIRKHLGEFYTPDWLARFLVELLIPTKTVKSVLDPSCGSGVFLLETIRKMRTETVSEDTILSSICGFDLNPIAVLGAKANIALALGTSKEIPVFERDSLDETVPVKRRFELILGNPPWINRDKLRPEFREKLQPLWKKFGLFNLDGNESRYGGAKKELAPLFTFSVAERFLDANGRLGFVMPLSIFQTRKAGEGFRRFHLDPSDTPMKVVRVDDFSELNPFGSSVHGKVATLLLEKGTPNVYPVTYFLHHKDESIEKKEAMPVEPTRPLSPWMIDSPGRTVFRTVTQSSEYQAFLGANSGGANGIYWVEVLDPNLGLVRNLADIGKKKVQQLEAEIEPELLFPLLRWRDVDRFKYTEPKYHIIIPQDPIRRIGIDLETMQTKYPKALRYFRRFEKILRERAAFRKYHNPDAPFYSMYNVGEQTFSPIKLVWRRMDTRIRAVVLERLIIPQETCSLIPCGSIEEANFLANIMNSKTVDELLRSSTVSGGKGFGSPGILNQLPIPKFDPDNPIHRYLSTRF